MAEYNNEVLEIEDTQKDRFLTFTISDEEFGIEIKYVTEIIKVQDITEVPDVNHYIKGVINLRGKIIPVMDMRLRFNKEPKEYHDRTCIIVIDVENITIGFIVDSVSEVINIPEENIVAPPDMNGNSHKYIKEIGKTSSGVKLILDCDILVRNDGF